MRHKSIRFSVKESQLLSNESESVETAGKPGKPQVYRVKRNKAVRENLSYPAGKPRDNLEQAIEQCDLPTLILERFPESATHRGAYQHATKAMLVAIWRNEKSPSVSVAFRAGRWVWHDFGSKEGGNAFHFLTRVCGLTPAQAAQELLERAGLGRNNHKPRQTPQDRQRREDQAFIGGVESLPALPEELFENTGDLNLERLADWLAACLRPAFTGRIGGVI